MLQSAGISEMAINNVLNLLAGLSTSLRGAMIVDFKTASELTLTDNGELEFQEWILQRKLLLHKVFS